MTVLKFKTHPAGRSYNQQAFPAFPTKSSLPPVNIYSTANGYLLELVAPGFTKEDIVISFDKNLLTIEGKMNVKEEAKNSQMLRNEYQFQSFKRSYNVDEDVDGELISAEYVNGVLRLNLPKKQPVKSPVKQIAIQ
jgi:HSP20 family protein